MRFVLAGALLQVAVAQGPNLAVNGSFELGPVVPGGFTTIYSPSNVIAGWEVYAGSVDLIHFEWVSAHGEYSLDLDGNSAGGVRQVIATTPGTAYEVSFEMAGNPGPPVKQMRVSAGATSEVFLFDTAGHTYANMGWVRRRMVFVATASTTSLEFRSLMPQSSSGGPALDDVVVLELPYFTPFGSGCAGSAGTPTFTPNQSPTVGDPFSVLLHNLPPQQIGLVVMGFDLSAYPAPLLDLGSAGLTGCLLYSAPDALELVPSTGVFGIYVWGTILPNDTQLIGLGFTLQFLFTDPPANPAGMILTNAAIASVGA